MPELISRAELNLIDWVKGRSGDFWLHFFEALCIADDENNAKMEKGFPGEVIAFNRYKNSKGYWDDLMSRYEINLSEAQG